MRFQSNKTVSCLPSDIQLDGRSVSVRNFQTLLSKDCCECMIDSTSESETIVGLFNSGSIRIDDILTGKINQYDILRTLPYQNTLLALSVPGDILSNVLSTGASLKGNGMFISYTGVETSDQGKTWIINGTDISKTGKQYNVGTTNYAKENIGLNNTLVTVLKEYNITQTKSLINYLSSIYPSC
jgi:2',3'-cyclic-nucleotide 2'-phosphodiesterase (5'-nucleotidase family)